MNDGTNNRDRAFINPVSQQKRNEEKRTSGTEYSSAVTNAFSLRAPVHEEEFDEVFSEIRLP